MDLPQDFCRRMEKYLGTEYPSFINSYKRIPAYGLRLNLLKYPEGRFPETFPFPLEPVPWTPEGFYVSYENRPGKHPLHEAGAYYIQEPSAMSVVSLLNPLPGETICDLCAAPGGKSTQIAARMQNKGLLVSNEIIPSRAKILSENIERLGVANAIVTNESPEGMSAHFNNFFDKILVDAPCSGEGMFKKDETAVHEWSLENVDACAGRQETILEHADRMLKSGGTLVYSTCTFSETENEEIIQNFLTGHPSYVLENWRDFFPENTGITSGRFLPETMRLFPHKLRGEGHFAARLRKADTALFSSERQKKKTTGGSIKPPADYLSFSKTFLTKTKDSLLTHFLESNKNIQLFGNELYLIPNGMNSLQGLKISRAGLHLGTLKKNRFEPAHALAKAAAPADFSQVLNCSFEEALLYLHGETLSCSPQLKGWTLVCYEKLSLGFGKASNGTLKNHYPKGLRKTLQL